jgi:phytoene synthase
MRADAVETSSAAALKVGSTSFAAAARLFDAQTRRDAQLLYAWCRHCDDVIDGQVLGHGRLVPEAGPHERLAELESQTRAALAGESVSDPAFIAFQRVALAHAIPARYPLDLLAGFQMDVEERRYRDIDETLAYAYHVAGVVGLMMALIMGVSPDDEETLDRACDLGLAFQLTNIARDVIEDAERGRVYLPESWLIEAGLRPDDLLRPECRDKVHKVALRLIDTADLYYASAATGLARLPLRAAMAIGAARAVYRGIGSRLRRLGPSAWDQRIATPRRQKLALVASGSLAGALSRPAAHTQPRPALWVRPGRGEAGLLG